MCNRELESLNRLLACYPPDHGAKPVLARVKDLITWGSKDNRFAVIHEILGEKIQIDIRENNINNISVGLRIYYELLRSARELNRALSLSLSHLIVQLISLNSPQLIAYADEAVSAVIQNAQRLSLKEPIQMICSAYLKYEPAFPYASLRNLVSQVSTEYLPVQSLLSALFQHKEDEEMKEVLIVLVHQVDTLTLSSFSSDLFLFLDANSIWEDEDGLMCWLSLVFTQISETCAPVLFCRLLEQLPPINPDRDKDNIVIRAILILMQMIPNERFVNPLQPEPLNMLLMFLFTLEEDDLVESTLTIVHNVAIQLSTGDSAALMYVHLWWHLPTETAESQTSYNERRIQLLLMFIDKVALAIPRAFTSKMVLGSESHIMKFLLSFTEHSGTIFSLLLAHMKEERHILSACRFECQLPFLLALQKRLKHGTYPHSLALHTFILCALLDMTSEAPEEFVNEVLRVRDARLAASPPQIFTQCDFVKHYLKVEPSVEGGEVDIMFRKKQLTSSLTVPKASIQHSIADLLTIEYYEEFEEEESDVDEELLIPMIAFVEEKSVYEDSSIADIPDSFKDALRKQAEIAAERKELEAYISHLDSQSLAIV